jgi:hypothetical protein
MNQTCKLRVPCGLYFNLKFCKENEVKDFRSINQIMVEFLPEAPTIDCGVSFSFEQLVTYISLCLG